MADSGVSVLARLKNKAAESRRSYQLCLQLSTGTDEFGEVLSTIQKFIQPPYLATINNENFELLWSASVLMWR